MPSTLTTLPCVRHCSQRKIGSSSKLSWLLPLDGISLKMTFTNRGWTSLCSSTSWKHRKSSLNWLSSSSRLFHCAQRSKRYHFKSIDVSSCRRHRLFTRCIPFPLSNFQNDCHSRLTRTIVAVSGPLVSFQSCHIKLAHAVLVKN